jgi:hypothetical protein
VAFFFKAGQMMKLPQQRYKNAALTVLCILLLQGFNCLQAQQTSALVVETGKTSFAKGDSIRFEASLADYKTIAKAATLQLLAENIKTGKKWTFRYPLINGYISAKLTIDSAMEAGVYALNFLLQKSFFSIKGRVANAGKKDKLLNYAMISKSKQSIIDIAELNEEKEFAVRNLLFQDSAFIIFSRPGKKKNDLEIKIETALDSSFIPIASITKFILIGDTASALTATDTAFYRFTAAETKYRVIMPEVVLRTHSGKRLQDFDSENSTGAFAGSDVQVLDGLSSDEMANAPDLYFYLTQKIGGLRVETDNETGIRSFKWRGQSTEIYINEIRLDAETPLWINPADIAMIKVYRPGTVLMANAAGGGAIAIYTKTGAYRQEGNRNYSFYILGYTGQEAVWK